MSKRASYFFVLDVFIASAILVLTLVIIFSSRINTPPPESSFLLAESYMNFLATTELRDTSGSAKQYLVNRNNPIITDSSMTLLQVIAFLKTEYPDDLPAPAEPYFTRKYVENMTKGLIPNQYSINYSIYDYSATNPAFFYYKVYMRPENDEDRRNSKESSHLVLSAKRITFYRNGRDIVGPMVTEVTIWS